MDTMDILEAHRLVISPKCAIVQVPFANCIEIHLTWGLNGHQARMARDDFGKGRGGLPGFNTLGINMGINYVCKGDIMVDTCRNHQLHMKFGVV